MTGPSSMGMNTVTTVMAFSVSAFFVIFVFTRLFCARIHLRAHHQSADATSFPAIHLVERGVSGTTEQSVVTAFPAVKLGDDDSQRPPAQEESQCTVCLEEYEAKDVVRALPYCGHAFHVACIDAWLRHHPTCPICRSTTTKHRAAAGAGTMPPLYYAVAVAGHPTSSSDHDALQQAEPVAPLPAVGADHMDVSSTRLEIVISDEPASSGAACPSGPSASEEHPCAETTSQSSQGNASEHSQC